MMSLEQMLKMALAVGGGAVGLAASCAPPLRSRPYAGGPQIGQVTVQRTQATAIGDVYSGKLQFPATFLMLASEGPNEAADEDSVFVHFKPLGKTYTITTITPVGTEPWFSFRNSVVGTVAIRDGTFIKTTENGAFQEFWVDIGAESTVTPVSLTFIYSKDIENFYIPARVNGDS